MHPYATESIERRTVPIGIFIVSIGLAFALNRILNAFQISLPWWFDAPSVFGFFGLLYSSFNKWFWKWKLWKKMGIVKVPILHGIWSGYLTSSFDDNAKEYGATLIISQTWTRICIIFKTEHSSSTSLTAGLIRLNPDLSVLVYHYMNEPKSSSNKAMHAHRGTALLEIVNDKVLEGEYYTGRDRLTCGRLKFTRILKKKIT